MIIYDEDAFFGSGEYEVVTVNEIEEYLTEEERHIFEKLCAKSNKRRHCADKKERMFSVGYEKARNLTNNYKGYIYHYYSPYNEMSEVEEAYNDSIQFEYLGG